MLIKPLETKKFHYPNYEFAHSLFGKYNMRPSAFWADVPLVFLNTGGIVNENGNDYEVALRLLLKFNNLYAFEGLTGVFRRHTEISFKKAAYYALNRLKLYNNESYNELNNIYKQIAAVGKMEAGTAAEQRVSITDEINSLISKNISDSKVLRRVVENVNLGGVSLAVRHIGNFSATSFMLGRQDEGAAGNVLRSYGGIQNNILRSYGGIPNNTLRTYGGIQNNILRLYGGIQNNIMRSYGSVQNNIPQLYSGRMQNFIYNRGAVSARSGQRAQEQRFKALDGAIGGIGGSRFTISTITENVLSQQSTRRNIMLYNPAYPLAGLYGSKMRRGISEEISGWPPLMSRYSKENKTFQIYYKRLRDLAGELLAYPPRQESEIRYSKLISPLFSIADSQRQMNVLRALKLISSFASFEHQRYRPQELYAGTVTGMKGGKARSRISTAHDRIYENLFLQNVFNMYFANPGHRFAVMPENTMLRHILYGKRQPSFSRQAGGLRHGTGIIADDGKIMAGMSFSKIHITGNRPHRSISGNRFYGGKETFFRQTERLFRNLAGIMAPTYNINKETRFNYPSVSIRPVGNNRYSVLHTGITAIRSGLVYRGTGKFREPVTEHKTVHEAAAGIGGKLIAVSAGREKSDFDVQRMFMGKFSDRLQNNYDTYKSGIRFLKTPFIDGKTQNTNETESADKIKKTAGRPFEYRTQGVTKNKPQQENGYAPAYTPRSLSYRRADMSAPKEETTVKQIEKLDIEKIIDEKIKNIKIKLPEGQKINTDRLYKQFIDKLHQDLTIEQLRRGIM